MPVSLNVGPKRISRSRAHTRDPRARRSRPSTVLGAALLTALFAPGQTAAQATVGFRSGFTEGNGIPPRGHVDIDYGTSAIGAGSTRGYTVGEVVAHLPLTHRFGLRMHLNSYSWVRTPQTQVAGLEDLGIGTAFAIRPNVDWRPSAALLTRLDMPSGSLPAQDRVWRPTVKIALGWRLPTGVQLASNIGLALPEADGTRYAQQFGSLWLGRNITGRFGAFSEVFAFAPESRSGPSTSYVRGGLTVLFTHTIHLDVNVSTQLGSAVPRQMLGIGVKHRL